MIRSTSVAAFLIAVSLGLAHGQAAGGNGSVCHAAPRRVSL